MDKLEWDDISLKKIIDLKLFEAVEIKRRAADGMESDFIRLDGADWVIVIAEISNNGNREYIIVKQFRHGSGSLYYEFPAGVVDSGEEPEKAALRELREETGYSAKKIQLIGKSCPNPAFMSNKCYTYLATDLVYEGELQLDPNERIETFFMSEEDIKKHIVNVEYPSAVIIQSWFWYKEFISKVNLR